MSDLRLADVATSGSGTDFITVEMVEEGGLYIGPEPELWPWIYGFILLQGLLVLALFRLRDPKQLPGLFATDKSKLGIPSPAKTPIPPGD
jgi:hypothetical protein